MGADFLQQVDTEVDILHEKTEKGHLEEFYNQECTFYYYIISGEGWFVLDGEKKPAGEGDLVEAPPVTRFATLGDGNPACMSPILES